MSNIDLTTATSKQIRKRIANLKEQRRLLLTSINILKVALSLKTNKAN